jgi:Bacterial TniB protein
MTIFADWVYDHPHYRIAHNQLCAAIDQLFAKGTPFLFTLLGATGVGKTEVLKDVLARYPAQAPAVRSALHLVAMPVSPAGEALAKRIIDTLVGKLIIRGSGSDIRAMAARMLVQAGVKVLILDELNHLIEMRKGERAQTTENRRTADWFKELLDQHGISIVLAGLPHTARFFSDNEQFKRRAMRPVEILPYAWNVEKDRHAFISAVNAFAMHMQSEGWTIDAEHDRLTRACYLSSSGSIGGLHKLMTAAELLCGEQRNLTMELCAKAFEIHFGMPDQVNPFELPDIPDLQLHKAYQDVLIKNSIITRTRGNRFGKD